VTSVAVTGSSGNAAIDRAAEADCRHWRFSAAHNPKTFSQTFKHNPE
jgi:TonB family protein